MNAAVLYASSHGKTRKVIARVMELLQIRPDVIDVKSVSDKESLLKYGFLLVFCPNYGDGELQQDMEVFLPEFNFDLEGKYFTICELGSYNGYDDFHFGVVTIIRQHLLGLHAREFCEPLSLDTLPRTNWGHLDDWVKLLNSKIERERLRAD